MSKTSVPPQVGKRPAARNPELDTARRLASGVAHQLNNLLTVVGGHASILLESTSPGQLGHQSARTLTEASRRGAELADQLLAYASHGPLHRQATSLSEPLGQLSDRAAEVLNNGIDLDIRSGSEPPAISTDPGRLLDALVHLVAYGAAVLGDRGRITVSASAVSATAAEVFVDVALMGDALTGTLDERDDLFEPYAPAAGVSKVHGLRLAAARGTIRQLGGTLGVAEGPVPLVFRIRLPALG